MKVEAHVAQYKKDIITEFVKLFQEYKVIGVINIENLPASQFQQIRIQLRKVALISVGKRRLMEIAIDQAKDSKKGLEHLKKHLGGMPALLVTNQDPFKIASLLRKSKSNAPAKPGQIAPRDIVIPAGPTPFSPGPIISELSQLGIKTSIEGGKVNIKNDVALVKEGEKIKPEVASILTKFGIEPMEIGIELKAVYENGIIYAEEILALDEAQFVENLKKARISALSLAMNIAYISKDTIDGLIKKAFLEANSLATNAEILNDETIKSLVAKAFANVHALQEKIKL